MADEMDPSSWFPASPTTGVSWPPSPTSSLLCPLPRQAFATSPSSSLQPSPPVTPLQPSTASTSSASEPSVDERFEQRVREKHRLVDKRRRQREAATFERLAALASVPLVEPHFGPFAKGRQRPRKVDRVTVLQSVSARMEGLLQRVAELESCAHTAAHHRNEDGDSAEAHSCLVWPVLSSSVPTSSPAGLLGGAGLVSNGGLLQGSIKALCVHAGTGRALDFTALAGLAMTGSRNCSLEQLFSPSWSACQRMLAGAAARGESHPFFYYSADETSPVDFVGTPEDPGLTQWLSDLYMLLSHRKTVIEGTKMFKMRDGRWHSSTSRLWLLSGGGRGMEAGGGDESSALQQVSVNWDTVVVVLSLSSHRMALSAEQSERVECQEQREAEAEVQEWRQWPAFSP